MPRTGVALVSVLIGLFWSSVLSASAQPLGTFRWQLIPYCNVLTLNITQQGGVYTLDGVEDRCGALQAASARGMAFLNPNGTIGFGVTIVQPGGTGVHLEATASLPLLSGTWYDSSGASGNFVLTPGAGIGGPPRGVPTSGVPPGSITSIQLAAGAVGASAVAPNAINGSHVLDGSLMLADIRDAPRAMSVRHNGTVDLILPTDQVVLQLTFLAPANGQVIVNASGFLQMVEATAQDAAVCAITTGLQALAFPQPYFTVGESLGVDKSMSTVPFGSTNMFSVAAGSSTTIRLVCLGTLGTVRVSQPFMTALFVGGS